MARVSCPLPWAWKEFSTLALTPETPLSQASSLASSGGTVVVVGATVVLVVDWPTAVESSLWPAHPPASATSRTIATRRAADRRVPAGMRKPPPALRRGEGRVPRDVLCLASWQQASQGDGAAATATSFDDAPCPTGRAVDPSRRGPQSSRRTLLPALVPVENATNADVVMTWSSESGELEQYASVRAGSARHREPLVLGGHQRSRSASKNRRSQCIHRHDLGRRSSPALGSNPTPAPVFWAE